MSKLERKSEGQPLRSAMRAAGLSGPDLATATKRVDPDGRGISPAIVGRLAGSGKTSRARCQLRTAWLIAEALDVPLQRLFSMPTHSTSTVERSRADAEEV